MMLRPRAAALLSCLVAAAASGCSKSSSSDTAPASTATTAPSAHASAAPPAKAAPPTISAEVQVPDGKSSFHVAWSLPAGTEINDDAPFAVDWRTSDALTDPPTNIRATGKDVRTGFDVPIEIAGHASSASLSGEVALVVCDAKNHAVCLPLKRQLEITFAVGKPREPASVVVELPPAKA